MESKEMINPYIIMCSTLKRENCPPAGTEYGKRCVKWHEIELITWGEGEILTEGDRIPCRKGTIFFRKPGMEVMGVSPYGCYLIVYDIQYSYERINSYNMPNHLISYGQRMCPEYERNDYHTLEYPYAYSTKRFDEFLGLFSSIYENFLFNRQGTELLNKSLLLQFLHMSYDEYNNTLSAESHRKSIMHNRPNIQRVMQLIDANPARKFTLKELSDYAGLSPSFFCRIFKEITGCTPVEYMNNEKINSAKRLLVESNSSIKEIALNLGFENESYFFIMFRSKTGTTPLQYRHTHKTAFF